MFELMLMRHAKSDWHSHVSDKDRALNERGYRDALAMGKYLLQMNLVPDRMIVSAARRTQETAEQLLVHLPVAEDNIVVDEALYLADRETLSETIELYAADKQRLLILAHNPGMDDLVSYLTSETPILSASGNLMSTASVACFRMASIAALKKKGEGELLKLFRPGEITNS